MSNSETLKPNLTLEQRILDSEQRLLGHRQLSGEYAKAMSKTFHNALTSPKTLIAAAALGFIGGQQTLSRSSGVATSAQAAVTPSTSMLGWLVAAIPLISTLASEQNIALVKRLLGKSAP